VRTHQCSDPTLEALRLDEVNPAENPRDHAPDCLLLGVAVSSSSAANCAVVALVVVVFEELGDFGANDFVEAREDDTASARVCACVRECG
jgi:hypothetical protein